MEKTTLKFVDAQTTTGIRMTSFGTTIEDTVKDFMAWVSENKVQKAEIVYADLFEKVDNALKVLAHLSLSDDGECILDPANESESPLKNTKRTLLDKIKGV